MRNGNQIKKGVKKMRSFTLTRDDMKKSYYGGLSNIQEDSCERLEIVTFTFDKNGKPGVLVWQGKQAKPIQYYRFSSVEKQMDHVQGVIESEVKYMEAKRATAAKKKAAVCPYKVGDILTGSWGYDQTNVDTYQVVNVKGKSVVLKAICQEIVKDSEGHMSCQVMPVKNAFLENSEEITKRPQTYNGENWYVKLHYSCHLSLWDGSSMYKSWYA